MNPRDSSPKSAPQPAEPTHRRAGIIAFAILLLATVGLSVWAWLGLLPYQAYPPDFDETVHLLPALQIAIDLRRLDLGGFLVHSYTQDQIALYPFFHSWLTAPFFLIGPPSALTGRTSSLVFLAAAVLVNFWLSSQLAASREWAWLAGLVGGGLTLGALPLWSAASITYLEPAGLLVSLLALAVYGRATPGAPSRRWLIAAGLLGVAALFTKFNFGFFVLGGMAAAEAIGALVAGKIPFARWRDLFGPTLIIAGLWFANPSRAQALIDYSHAQHSNLPIWTLTSLTYYPVNILSAYAAGPIAAALVLLGVGLALARLREHRNRAVVGYLAVSLVVLLLVPQKGPRFDFTVAPAALALAGLATGALAARLGQLPWPAAKRIVPAAVALGLGLLALGVAQRLVWLPAAQEVAYDTSPDTARAYDFLIENTLAKNLRPHLLNDWYLYSADTVNWEYAQTGQIDPATGNYHVAGDSLAPEPNPADLAALRQLLAAEGANVLVSIDGSPAGQYPGWNTIQPLWSQGYLQPLADSNRYTFYILSDAYRDELFAGAFTSAAQQAAARAAARGQLQIRLHLYSLP